VYVECEAEGVRLFPQCWWPRTIRVYISAARKNAKNIFEAVKDTLNGKIQFLLYNVKRALPLPVKSVFFSRLSSYDFLKK
jgi:hypothetical protein